MNKRTKASFDTPLARTSARRETPLASARFDHAYYARFYENPNTRVTDRGQVERLAGFVTGYLRYLDVSVRRVLDLGCGMGLWREPLARAFPEARYQGVELSPYLCERFGWTLGSVVDFSAKQPFDLVVCQGVLPYLGAADARRALANLARLCRGALYLEAVTTDDFREGVVDRRRTDAGMQLRSRAFYLRALAPHFVGVGGGVFVARSARVSLYALESL